MVTRCYLSRGTLVRSHLTHEHDMIMSRMIRKLKTPINPVRHARTRRAAVCFLSRWLYNTSRWLYKVLSANVAFKH